MAKATIGRRSFIGGVSAAWLISAQRLHAQPRPLKWSTQDQLDFAAFVPNFAQNYQDKIDCADLALDALITFAADRRLPVRLFDFDGPPGHRKRWLTYNPRSDDWRTTRAFLLEQLGAINVIENSRKIELDEVRSGDLIMHENTTGGGYTGHTRLLISAKYDADKRDHYLVRYEGTLPPVVPELKQGWFSELDDVYGGSPRRWNFGQFSM
jgi:hypothetical protein